MIVRSFSLLDLYGREYSLNQAEKTALLTDPQGLGYEFSTTYIDVGDAFVRTKYKGKQAVISGTLIFGSSSPYSLYTAFRDFVREAVSLRLVYQPPGSSAAYYRDVDLVTLEKTEMEEGVLKSAVKFYCKSLFYSDTKNYFIVTAVEGEMRYDITWPATYNDYSERSVQLSNTGDVEAPFTATLQGYCENPTITLMKDGEAVKSVTFPVTLQSDELILYSTLDDDLYVYQVDADGNKTNIMQLLDIDCDNFFKIPTGDYSIRFTSDTGAAYTTTLVMYKFYRTV